MGEEPGGDDLFDGVGGEVEAVAADFESAVGAFGAAGVGGVEEYDAGAAADAWLNTPGNMAVSRGGNGGLTLVGTFPDWVP